jgi:hypothetical protein
MSEPKIYLNCSSCGREVWAPPRGAGRNAPCPKCGTSCEIPFPGKKQLRLRCGTDGTEYGLDHAGPCEVCDEADDLQRFCLRHETTIGAEPCLECVRAAEQDFQKRNHPVPKPGPPPLLPVKSGPPPLPSREEIGPALAVGLAAGVVAANLLDGGEVNAANSAEGTVFADLDGDGVVDSAFGDIDGDGVLDHGVTDIDGDGLVDLGFTDMNQDGAIDAVVGDANGDGILDHAVIDSDFDGVVDASWVDTDMDGVVDLDEITDVDDGGFLEDLLDLF